MAKPTFSTTDYQMAHGKMPRGEGSWAFFFGSQKTPVFFPMSSYGEAKKKACAHAQKHGFTFVRVGS